MNAASARAPLPPVPTNIIYGYRGAGKTAAILGFLARKPAAEHWAVLVNGKFGAGNEYRTFSGSASRGVSARYVAGGCVCCTARVGLRVALVDLLRRARPQRLLIEPAGTAHLAAVMAALREPGLAEAVDMHASICIANPRQFADPDLAAVALYREHLALADVVVAYSTSLAEPAQTEALLHFVRDMTPPKRLVIESSDGGIPPEVLDLAAERSGTAAASRTGLATCAA